MKILQIYKDYYPPVIGGIEKHINLLAKGLVSKGHDVEILISNIANKLDVGYYDGIKVTKARQWGRFMSAPLNPTFPYLIHKLGKKSDILHFHLPNPTAVIGYLLSGLNKPVVVTYHSDIVRQRRLRTIFTPFLKFFLRNSAIKIITTSPDLKKNSRLLQYYQDKCEIIPIGINVKKLLSQNNNSNIVNKIKNTFGPRIILFVGKFRYYKGISVLIEAIKNVDAKLLLVGNGPFEKDIKLKIHSLQLDNKVIFFDEVSDELLLVLFKACDIFVLPSVKKSEAFGIVLLEAMIHGKPVISTQLNTGTSFVNMHNETGLVIQANNPSELEKSMNILLSNPSLMTSLGEKGKERVKKYFDSELMINRICNLYNNL